MSRAPAAPLSPALGRHVVVVSPHCDDAVLSVGGLLAAHARAGGRASVVTVLAGLPSSTGPAGPWDAVAGDLTEGCAAARRRAEDVAACAVVGAQPVHLDERDEQYVRRHSDDELWALLRPHLEDADEILLPGFPLRQADHAHVTRLVLQRLEPSRRVRLYVEEPYGLRERSGHERQAALGQQHLLWQRPATSGADVLAKVRAVRCYRSQLPLLGPGRLSPPSALGALVVQCQLWAAARRRGERVTAPVPVTALRGPEPV